MAAAFKRPAPGIVSPAVTAPRGIARAILEGRCPACRTGKMFVGVLKMNNACPHCGLRFEREPGYYLGSLYISYGFSVAFLVAFFFLGTALWPRMDSLLVAALAAVPYLPLMPLVFRYSRILWVYFDRHTT